MYADASHAALQLRRRDNSGAYDDLVEMMQRLGQKAKRLVEVVSCRHVQDTVVQHRPPRSSQLPPRPQTYSGPRGPHPEQAGGSTWHGSLYTTPRPPHPEQAGGSAWDQGVPFPDLSPLRGKMSSFISLTQLYLTNFIMLFSI